MKVCLIGIFTTLGDTYQYNNLKSYISHIDNYLFIDNGLSSKELSLIKDIMKSIKGRIMTYKEPIESFSDLRNKSIWWANKLYKPDFVIETDDTWEIHGFKKSLLNLNVDYYCLDLKLSELNLLNHVLKIYRPSMAKYKGRVHEYIEPKSQKIDYLSDCYLLDCKLDLERTSKRDDENMMIKDVRENINAINNLYQLGLLMEIKGRIKEALEFYESLAKEIKGELAFMVYIRLAYLKKNKEHFFDAMRQFPERSAEAYYYIHKIYGDPRALVLAKKCKYPRTQYVIPVSIYEELGIMNV